MGREGAVKAVLSVFLLAWVGCSITIATAIIVGYLLVTHPLLGVLAIIGGLTLMTVFALLDTT
jgi:hypothetical protein